ncbi:glutaredoxin 3 [Colwellia sp. E150_009]|tara:strand:- start:661 stop:939 length:279 start_codon:yes stop_codon:yes gene_type:complete
MAKVDIYTKAYCPFCSHAMALLEQKQLQTPSLQVNEISIDGDVALREKMIERSKGGYTVPQIFIDDVHVGGCDQLVALDRNNQLDALLSENK